MIERVLLAVDDSPSGLQAGRVAVELAAARHACLRIVHVVPDGKIAAVMRTAVGDPSLRERRWAAGEHVLSRVARIAAQAGVPSETYQLDGGVADQVLAQAQAWPADLIVMGRGSVRRPGEPFVGSQTRHVLEFADRPVLVVPGPALGGNLSPGR